MNGELYYLMFLISCYCMNVVNINLSKSKLAKSLSYLALFMLLLSAYMHKIGG